MHGLYYKKSKYMLVGVILGFFLFANYTYKKEIIMNLLELFLIAIGLSMDAFAVALCLGLTMKKVTAKKALIVGLYFGIFQAAMPLIGYLIGTQFADKVVAFGHWVAFILLCLIGGKMIVESFKVDKCSDRECPAGKCSDRECPGRQEASLKFKDMLPLALATSIDALAVGISFAFLKVNVAPAIASIGVITLALSMVGVKIGNIFGSKFKSKAELAGGIILVLMGIKILIEHMGVI